jgi:hypothetical protein
MDRDWREILFSTEEESREEENGQFAMSSMRRCLTRDILVYVIGGIVNCIQTKQQNNGTICKKC